MVRGTFPDAHYVLLNTKHRTVPTLNTRFGVYPMLVHLMTPPKRCIYFFPFPIAVHVLNDTQRNAELASVLSETSPQPTLVFTRCASRADAVAEMLRAQGRKYADSAVYVLSMCNLTMKATSPRYQMQSRA